MRYDERIVDQVQSAHDIVEVIGQYLTLKRSGRNFKACCPFHGEKTPSFMVQPEKQIFHCFGCSLGGDVFTFVMRQENMSFPEALRMLAEKAGIRLPEPDRRQGEGPSESEQLYEIYRLAAEYYHGIFKDPERGKAGREYFQKRGFDLSLADELKMGWSLDGWRGLLEYLLKKGFSENLLLKTSLVVRSPKGNLYDTFRERLLFPIANLQGKIVAFGGRILKDVEGSPKYLNSPENPIFQKRRELFGLYLAKKFIDREKPRIVVVEGYFGWLRLYQHGFKSVVATLGTALTEEHVHVLKRFAEEAVVIYDGDKAGEAASLRGLEVFLEGGMSVRLVKLPSGYDPDDFIMKEGAEAFGKLLSNAPDFFDYKLEILFSRFNRMDSMGLMRITSDFLETFTKIQSPILVDRYLRKLAGSLGVDETSLRSELQKLKKKQEKPGNTAAAPVGNISKTGIPPAATDETLILALSVEETSLRKKLLVQCDDSDFSSPQSRELFQCLATLEAEQQPVSWPKVFTRIHDAAFREKLTSQLSMEWNFDQKKQAFEDCLGHIKAKKVEKRLEELRRSIAKAERDGDTALLSEYAREYQALWKENKTPARGGAA
jgi:DNA primase